MYKRSKKYTLEGTRVMELVNGNWLTIANFHHQAGGAISPNRMAENFYNTLNTKRGY
jgi:hypothetical protein